MLENEGYNRKICVLGVAGGSASGKTTIINRVKDYFGNDIAVISHDNYYKAHDDMPFEESASLIMIILIPLNQREWQRMSVSSLKAIP